MNIKNITIAYIDEPPFYWTEKDGSVKGADIELIETILQEIGVSSIEYHHTTFEELLSGIQAGQWDINVPIFVTEERAQTVSFSIPVWALGDGFVVQKDNPKQLTSYEAVAMKSNVKLGIIPGQVQYDKARSAGINESQIILFKNQDELIAALKSETIDAFAATAVGNNAIVKANPEFQSVPLKINKEDQIPVGAFSFSKNSDELLNAVNEQLSKYLGSADHREKMAKYGITASEIDSIVPNKNAK